MKDFARLVAEYEHRKEKETLEKCRQDIATFLTIFPDGKPLLPMSEEILDIYLAFIHAQTTLERLARKRRQMAAASAIEELLRNDDSNKSNNDGDEEDGTDSEGIAVADDEKSDSSSNNTKNGLPSPLISTSKVTSSENGGSTYNSVAGSGKPADKNYTKSGRNSGPSKSAIDKTVGDTESTEKSGLDNISIADNDSNPCDGDDVLPDEEILPYT